MFLVDGCEFYRKRSKSPAASVPWVLAIGADPAFLQGTQWATVLLNFSILLISIWWLGYQSGTAYSNWGQPSAFCTAALVSFGAIVKFRLRKHGVLVALEVIFRGWHKISESTCLVGGGGGGASLAWFQLALLLVNGNINMYPCNMRRTVLKNEKIKKYIHILIQSEDILPTNFTCHEASNFQDLVTPWKIS